MQSLSSQGGMVGRLLLLVEKEVLLRREGWEVDILVTATDLWSVHWITNYFERLFDWLFVCQNFALGRNVSLIFCHANAKLALKHWTIIVIENITNSIPVFDPPLRYKICVVPVRSTWASAKWYRRVSMNHLSVTSRFPLVCDKNSKGKRDVFIMVSQHGVQLIQLSMKLSWHIQATDNKIFRAESVTFTDFYVLPTENIGKQQ